MSKKTKKKGMKEKLLLEGGDSANVSTTSLSLSN
jgi:hypothetical protein